ncbi:MAG: M23 family metallopeptidase [Myxococcales bacterium]|nr:M23 family metallopeptidase [Myxococcales bacterium]
MKLWALLPAATHPAIRKGALHARGLPRPGVEAPAIASRVFAGLLQGAALFAAEGALAQPPAQPAAQPPAQPPADALAQPPAGVDADALAASPPAAQMEFVRIEDGHTGETIEIPAAWIASWAGGGAAPIEPPAAASPAAPAPAPAPPAPPPPFDRRAAALNPSRPQRWQQPAPRRCRRYRGRSFCDGPLRIPVAEAESSARAEALGVGHARTANRLLGAGPDPRWVRAAAAISGREEAPGTLLWPVDGGRIWRGLKRARGAGRHRRPAHKGVDFGAPEGTIVRAADDGLVVYANNELRGYGNLVMLVHPDASVTLYAHLQAAWVTPGMLLARGAIVGEVGHTGLARGAHLHFEWRRDGAPRDPLPRMVDRPERGAQGAPPAEPGPIGSEPRAPILSEPGAPGAPEGVHEPAVNGASRSSPSASVNDASGGSQAPPRAAPESGAAAGAAARPQARASALEPPSRLSEAQRSGRDPSPWLGLAARRRDAGFTLACRSHARRRAALHP